LAHRRYIHVFPPVAHYLEVVECYRAAAARMGWMSVELWSTWSAERPEWRDPDCAVIFWGYISPPHIFRMVPQKRSAALVLRNSESIGYEKDLDPGQVGVLDSFKKAFKSFDAVFVGSPLEAEFLRPWCPKIGWAPVGYEPEVMGAPDWKQRKDLDLVFYGAPYGRREWILPALRRHFGKRLLVCPVGTYGLRRKRFCERSRAILHVGHAREVSAPGFRIAQIPSTSAAFITESQDAWPAVHKKHFVALPMARKDHMDAFIDRLEEALKLPLEAVARAAHKDLSKFTVERAMWYYTSVI